MSGTTWTKFFWSDWSNDPALKLCSLASQGLWMRCLCVAAEADPTGYVTVNGRTLGATDIARLAGVTEIECEPLLAELERNGVFSRARNGTIYSRRMIKDHKRAKIAKQNGSQGGNPSLCNGKGNSYSDNLQDKGSVKTQIPITSNPERKGVTHVTPKNDPKSFDAFWLAYPNKVGKPKALDAYRRATSRASPEEILRGLSRIAPNWTDPKFIPHPTTWLNRDGWNDQIPEAPPHERRNPNYKTAAERGEDSTISAFGRVFADLAASETDTSRTVEPTEPLRIASAG